MMVNRIMKESADELLLSVEDISKLCGLPICRISAVIDNNSSATPSEAYIICESLGVDLERILKYDGDKTH